MTPDETAALNRSIANLLDRWKVDPQTAARILDIEPDLYSVWKRGGVADLDEGLKLRLVLLLNIHVQLTAAMGKGQRGYDWMSKPNDAFGQSPIDMLRSGGLNALLRLQSYLAASIQYP